MHDTPSSSGPFQAEGMIQACGLRKLVDAIGEMKPHTSLMVSDEDTSNGRDLLAAKRRAYGGGGVALALRFEGNIFSRPDYYSTQYKCALIKFSDHLSFRSLTRQAAPIDWILNGLGSVATPPSHDCKSLLVLGCMYSGTSLHCAPCLSLKRRQYLILCGVSYLTGPLSVTRTCGHAQGYGRVNQPVMNDGTTPCCTIRTVIRQAGNSISCLTTRNSVARNRAHGRHMVNVTFFSSHNHIHMHLAGSAAGNPPWQSPGEAPRSPEYQQPSSCKSHQHLNTNKIDSCFDPTSSKGIR
ncbi:hypothetical protein BKA67DRAFT_54075 [Truncatella angustata]|uniref:Uncharacterized protein n=1 Tax=Truncatella angustata TaxID=152316 RepID=A0A9P8UYK7_9PEZI|nr:uncharacterized protein BKA67DRAFT_54075 [Truncatella angustata]KAH6660510.1 hypothetical protein BKA67DRAFT_54075 [Truncatella angustata]